MPDVPLTTSPIPIDSGADAQIQNLSGSVAVLVYRGDTSDVVQRIAAGATAVVKPLGRMLLAKAETGTATIRTSGVPPVGAAVSQQQLANVVSGLPGTYTQITGAAGVVPTLTSGDGSSVAILPLRGRKPMQAPSRVISRFASGHGWTNGADDTTVKLSGDRSYKGTTNGSAGSLYLSGPTITAQDWSTGNLRLVLRVDDPTRLATNACNVTTGTGNVFTANLQLNWISNEWVVCTVPRACFTVASGTPVWTGVTKIELRFVDKGSSQPANVWIDSVDLVPDSGTAPIFVLECDDAYQGQLTQLLPVTSVRGVPVTINPITERITSGAAVITADDLRTLQNKHGWQVSCHAYSNATHGGPVTTAQLEADFAQQRAWNRANGLASGADHYALCPGTGTPVAEGALMDTLRRNFDSVRVNSGTLETYQPADPHKLRSRLFTTESNAQIQSLIDLGASTGGVFILAIHDVIAGATNGTSNGLPAMGATNVATILDYAATKGYVFRTRGDLIAA